MAQPFVNYIPCHTVGTSTTDAGPCDTCRQHQDSETAASDRPITGSFVAPIQVNTEGGEESEIENNNEGGNTHAQLLQLKSRMVFFIIMASAVLCFSGLKGLKLCWKQLDVWALSSNHYQHC
jgi:hypothetical protein